MTNKRTQLMALCVMIVFVSIAVFGVAPKTQAQSSAIGGSNWQGYYWNNATFSGSPAGGRIDPTINFNWGFNSPIAGVNADNFSVRWYNTLHCSAGTYQFRGGADDGIAVAIDGVKIINRMTEAGGFVTTYGTVTLPAGDHQIIVDYYEKAGQAGVLVDWTSTSGALCDTIVPSGSGTTFSTGTPFATAIVGPTSTPVPPPVRAVIIADIVNVRSAPSTDSDIVQVVYKNEDFKVVAQNGFNTWFLLDLGGGRTGWVWRTGLIYLYNGDHTKLPVITTTVKPAPAQQDVQGYARFMVFVRSLPSTRNSEKLGVINQGEYFKVIKRYSRNRAWVYVDYNGLQGWVFLPNIRIVQGYVGLLPIGN